MTTLIFLLDGLIPDLLATGPVIVTQIVAWGGGWIVASIASFNFKLELSNKIALSAIAGILMFLLVGLILFAGIMITGDLGR